MNNQQQKIKDKKVKKKRKKKEKKGKTKSTRSVQLLRQMTHHLRLYVHGISLSLSTLYCYESRPNTFECKISIKSGKNRKLLFFAM